MAAAVGVACATPGEWRTFPPELDVPVELGLKLTLASLDDHLDEAGIRVLCLGRLRSLRPVRSDAEELIAWERRMVGRVQEGSTRPVVSSEGCGRLGGRYVLRTNDTPAAVIVVRPIDERADGSEQHPYVTGFQVLVDNRDNAGQFRITYEFSLDPQGWWIDGVSCTGPREPCERVRTTMPVGATPALPDTLGRRDATAPRPGLRGSPWGPGAVPVPDLAQGRVISGSSSKGR